MFMTAARVVFLASLFSSVVPQGPRGRPTKQALLSSGDILVTSGRRGSRGVLRIDRVTGVASVLTSGGNFGDPADIVVNPHGRIFVADGDRTGTYGGRPQVVSIDPETGIQTVVTAGGNLLSPYGIALGPDGQIYVADYAGPVGQGGIIRIDPTTGAQTVVFFGATFARIPFVLAFESSGDVLFGVRNAFGSLLYRLDLMSGDLFLLAPDVGVSEDIVVDSAGNIFVADGGLLANTGRVLHVDPVSGLPTPLSSGGFFTNLTGISREADGLLVSQDNAVIRVDPITGAQEVVAMGGILTDLTGVDVFPALALAVGLDIRPGACPNPFNLRSQGFLPVALIGSDDFDPRTVDLSTLMLSRADSVDGGTKPTSGPQGPHTTIEDVATPFVGGACDCQDLGGDGVADLLMHFRADELVGALGLGNLLPGDIVELEVTGHLLDGVPFTASDCILLVPGTPSGSVR